MELNVLLHSANAAGLQFGMTDDSSGYRLRIQQDSIVLLDDGDNELAEAGDSHVARETPLHILLRLQQTGWLVEVNEQAVGTVAAGPGLLPEIRLFVEEGQAFFTEISAYGLRPPDETP